MPNRKARRAAERKEARRVLLTDHGAITGTDMQFEFKGTRELPPKVPGKHRWMAFAQYSLSQESARRAFDPAEEKHLDMENLLDVTLGCWDCEKPLTKDNADSSCPAPGSD